MFRFECRIVLHEMASGESHLDLFIKRPDREELITYELAGRLYKYFENLRISEELKSNKILLIARSVTAIGRDEKLIPAFRKKDHRTLYWDYEGEISDNRGRITEIVRGAISGDIEAENILLTPP